MGGKSTDLIKGFLKRSIGAIQELVIRLRNYIIEKQNKRVQRPPDKAMNLIFALTWFLYVFGVVWIISWLSLVTVDSAKWALSAQVQATAAIFGLLIAAIAFRWRRVTEQEDTIRDNIHSYLRMLGLSKATTPHGGTTDVINLEYGNALNMINSVRKRREKVGKQLLIDLGRLWAIRYLAAQYLPNIKIGRFLTAGQTKHLKEVDKLCEQASIEMNEMYYRHPEDFLLTMQETFLFRDNDLIKQILNQMIRSNSKVIAEEVRRTRLGLRPRFYFTSLILAFAIVLGLCVLTGIEGTLFPFSMSSNPIAWAVGVPIGLSLIGIASCLALIRNII